MTKRKLCVVTGTRAEYGLLTPLMHQINNDPDLELQIIATGMHLSPEFGLTYRLIEDDGFRIDAKVEMLLSSDSPVGIAKSMGLATIGFADAFERLQPDVLILLGDRYEILAAAQTAMVARIPIAHLHGGESTEGLIDEAIRHAVTKMSHLHYVAADPYRQRVLQLGEQPDRVLNVGAPGIDNIVSMKRMTREELEESIGFRLGDLLFLVTYHPVTLQENHSEQAMRDLFQALDQFPEATVLFTKPNSDTDGRIMAQMIDDYAARWSGRVLASTSLGQKRYLSAIAEADAVIGNSSSGLIEVPVFKKPTVNIGDRQKGRLKPESVIDCGESASEIEAAIRKALSPVFQEVCRRVQSPFGDGQASRRIKEHLKHVDLQGILFKKFYACGDGQ